MSQEVSLNAQDYTNVLRWFELAFAKRNSIPQLDRDTFNKFTVMALAFTEEIKNLKSDDNV